VTAATRTPADEFPAAVRFAKSRTRHRVRVPDGQRWWDLLHAACGKTGFHATGYGHGPVGECRGCARVVECGT
jgi:hypothetical protein